MLVETILAEYQRIISAPVTAWTMESRRAELNKLRYSLLVMKDAGALSASEYADIQTGMEYIDSIMENALAEKLAAAYKKCFR